MRLASVIFAFLVLPLSADLQTERWEKAKLRPERISELNRVSERLAANRARYDEVQRRTSVPAHVIAALHNMEASGSFQKHLHEGSSLGGRTRWIPKGRPIHGKPPFRWEDSAVDALFYDNMHRVKWSSLSAALHACEAYNGTGYLRFHRNVPTPYLWSGTTIYSRGKYVADGKWDPMAVSGQVGVAAIWKRMIERKIIKPPKP